ncbi:phosphatase PAP2 family protein [Enterovibrio norvegicus]|uniref:phosphatase PAP2 family protein n=1 Tax=Enterovibrio norvegicus TaxID=188144 RepID=UPI0010BF3A9E|nr:phosphatase PAP2 family protein [Enterovibrio norvegicus]TKF31031.1 phosphatase PAP2 family protein [Enterovibrio norvegicus]
MVFQKKYGLMCAVLLCMFLSFSALVSVRFSFVGEVNDALGGAFSFLSWSAGSKGFLFTTALLCAIPFFLKWPRQRVLVCLSCFAFVLGASFVTKTVLKSVTQEARPYTYVLQDLGAVDSADGFYSLSSAQRVKAIDTVKGLVSEWRLPHWEGETNYSFPSGHTIFAACAAIFWGAILLSEGHRLLAVMLAMWAGLVGMSRLWLGMHWSVDLFGSLVFATGICLLVPIAEITIFRRGRIQNNQA